ncbi:unnamed protein product [Paramecium sonneborni]|uniref:Uncharacterized protein n=1 Tax=Paramecium sonneborni TaxID=65129 RepID=A0A8S1RFC4_9CILI|nr:unnamed protein product [Paramecium sonneborni]
MFLMLKLIIEYFLWIILKIIKIRIRNCTQISKELKLTEKISISLEGVESPLYWSRNQNGMLNVCYIFMISLDYFVLIMNSYLHVQKKD